jgi:uncharacterized protein (TIGR01777 family)
MNILIAGGSGFIGRALTDKLVREGHALTLLTRRPSRGAGGAPGLTVEEWDASSIGPWSARVREADVVINLTGELIGGKRWTPAQKEVIRRSRIDSTRAIVEAIAKDPKRPALLVNASAVGYYGSVPAGDVPESFPAGRGFLAEVCREWEEAAYAATPLGVRVITVRLGVVLAPQGGALDRMLLPFKLFVGGTIGGGAQWFPWIHRDDVVAGILFLLRSPMISGPVNFVGPEPVTMRDFCRRLGAAMGRPSWAPVPAPVLRLLLGEMAGMILTGQRAVPKKLLDAGFAFRHPTVAGALREILHSS